jgi:hypothetical protein
MIKILRIEYCYSWGFRVFFKKMIMFFGKCVEYLVDKRIRPEETIKDAAYHSS